MKRGKYRFLFRNGLKDYEVFRHSEFVTYSLGSQNKIKAYVFLRIAAAITVSEALFFNLPWSRQVLVELLLQ